MPNLSTRDMIIIIALSVIGFYATSWVVQKYGD